MRHLRPSLVLIGTVTALAALPSGALAADELAAAFARLDKAAPAFRGFSADVRKVQHTELIHEDDPEIGKTIVRRAKPHELQVRVDIDPPNEKRIAVDGPKVETYYPKSNSIQTVLVGKASKPMMEQFLLLGWGSTSPDLTSAYNVTYGGQETVAGQKTVRLDLVPKDKDILAHVPKFELWISEEAATSGLAVQVKFSERAGDYSVATYTNMKLRPVSESEVKLNAPKDARREKPIRY